MLSADENEAGGIVPLVRQIVKNPFDDLTFPLWGRLFFLSFFH